MYEATKTQAGKYNDDYWFKLKEREIHITSTMIVLVGKKVSTSTLNVQTVNR